VLLPAAAADTELASRKHKALPKPLVCSRAVPKRKEVFLSPIKTAAYEFHREAVKARRVRAGRGGGGESGGPQAAAAGSAAPL
jgi:hypothetical protein